MTQPRFWHPIDLTLNSEYGDETKFLGIKNAEITMTHGLLSRERVDNYPVIQISVRHPTYAPDFFGCGMFAFASERARKVMNLPDDEVQYLEVDDSNCSDYVKAQNYKAMNILKTCSVSDPGKSGYSDMPLPKPEDIPEGFTMDKVMSMRVRRIAINPDAKPDASIFYDDYFPQPFCTDELAMTVLRAGLTGMTFFDPSTQIMTFNRRRFRTLRGVEEEHYDAKGRFSPKLVGRIDD